MTVTAIAPAPPPVRGWWRRNVWGLLTVLPLLVTAAAIGYADDVTEDYWDSQPRQPISAATNEWAQLGGARIRLVELVAATDLANYAGEPIQLPAGVLSWRAVIEFDAPDQDAVAGCKITLEDRAGRQYGTRPDELDQVRAGYPGCTADSSAGVDLRSYRTEALFVTPVGAEPVAVRITWITKLPIYLRLLR